jgi:large subunit ribosomal protein L9
VSTRDIADVATAGGFSVERNQVRLDRPIKMIGIHDIMISLHPEVEVPITINVARSADEAERQTRGEDLTRRNAFDDEDETEEPVESGFAAGPGSENGAGEPEET